MATRNGAVRVGVHGGISISCVFDLAYSESLHPTYCHDRVHGSLRADYEWENSLRGFSCPDLMISLVRVGEVEEAFERPSEWLLRTIGYVS